ncbi:hypothetical protein A2801_02465 [Candidatus Woesebacteria bacterium RIFCSPHIGHO2_01_FULL_41_10]|uniref:DUF4900 domain-containing protein n=1 Tax=Candidatus Woesebacteria bacterium RIFCSPHIGHO2_01_FULL_41_10 TaxID=1802500 RepID=A0A1F7YNW5_9BACT|nr:MAG: hypothetical protein A2801_02465 [Candidatus Woesebacteria bacterium RIFCSPHIGHO2_01_FULL_41_10]
MKKKKLIWLGSVTPALLVLTGAFLVVIYALLFLLAAQLEFSNRQVLSEQSLSIAESGVNYYRWHLAHAPDDFQDGTGGAGPYLHDFTDPEGNIVGQYSLEVIAPQDGSSIVTIRSTGHSNVNPSITRTIEAQYGQPSLARYSFLQHAASWYGSGITVNGDVHSNTGIRMDGTNTARVTSAQEQYTCGSETGCSPATYMPGVWGAGGDTGLWEYPVPQVPFSLIQFNFDDMQQNAINDGLYLEASGARGYHLVFSSNGTVNVRRVTNTNYYYGYESDDGCQRRYQRITGETSIGTYNVDDIPIIFAEDHLWVEGTVNGRITVVAARFPTASNEMNIWIRNNLLYAAYDGTNSLGLIAQHDIYFVRDIPNNFQVDAALMAQGGKIIRHGYFSWCQGTTQAIKDSLTINGAVISFEKSYWNFGSGPTSGFITRTINYDGNLLFMPPPYFPVSGEYEFISWKEE